MADEEIEVRLSLQDRFTAPVQNATTSVNSMQDKVKEAKKNLIDFGKKANEGFLKVAKGAANMGVSVAKDAAKAATSFAKATVKGGFDEALNLEEYRLKLNNVTKDTQKAGEVMKTAVEMANKTPFETGELVDGAANFEEIGMSAEEWLPLAGNMAASSNKDFSKATDALISAQKGEISSLEEFGIEKADLVKKAGEMFGYAQVMSNDGQIKDQEKFNQTLSALMTDKFAGAMEKKASTIKGLWDQVTGTTKTALAKILGMSEDGIIAAGSPLEKLKEIIQTVVDTIGELQSSGKIDEVSKTVSEVFTVAVNAASTAISWLKDNMDWLLPTLEGLFAAFALCNIVLMAHKAVLVVLKTVQLVSQGVTLGLAAAQWALNAAFIASTVGWVVLGILALIAVGVLLYKNWDTVKEKASELWGKVQEVFGGIRDSIVGVFQSVMETVGGIIDGILEKIQPLLDKVHEFIEAIKENPVVEGFINGWDIVKDKVTGINSSNATGTPYFKGGLTHINEGGRGEIVNLPNGTQIIPHDISKRQTSQPTVNVSVNVQGNVIGNSEYANYIGGIVARRVVSAYGNV